MYETIYECFPYRVYALVKKLIARYRKSLHYIYCQTKHALFLTPFFCVYFFPTIVHAIFIRDTKTTSEANGSHLLTNMSDGWWAMMGDGFRFGRRLAGMNQRRRVILRS